MLRLRRLKRASKVNALTLINTGFESQSEREVITIHFAAIVTAAIQFRQALVAHGDRNVGNGIQNRQALKMRAIFRKPDLSRNCSLLFPI